MRNSLSVYLSDVEQVKDVLEHISGKARQGEGGVSAQLRTDEGSSVGFVSLIVVVGLALS